MTETMAPIELQSLSSNWKKLQQTLKPGGEKKPRDISASKSAPLPPTSKPRTHKTGDQGLKRKRSTTDGTHDHSLSEQKRAKTTVSQKASSGPRKRTESLALAAPSASRSKYHKTTPKGKKMEEPTSIGGSAKRHDEPSLNRSISMPSLRRPSLLTNPTVASESISVLTPSPNHPDVENEGVSPTAIPGKYIGLDCEMVGVGPEPDRDSCLARVSLVDYQGHQVYDSYVLPPSNVKITDYRTDVSGIEPRHLRPGFARPFKEVQDDVKVLLAGRILVGHALKNDLSALILKHPPHIVRDTSRYPKFKEMARIPGRTPALKKLVHDLLGVEIQTGRHSSVEDARATMALFRLEKDGIEQDIVRRYGHIKVPQEDEDAPPQEGAKSGKNKKKKNKGKKKKKKHSTIPIVAAA